MAATNGTQTIAGDNIKEFTQLDIAAQELINAAIEVRKRAYCPYSGFAVGAALRTVTGEIVTGCNVENGAYGPSVCAERCAISKAISEGHREFVAAAVVAHQEHNFTSPCGVCRQYMMEFAHKDFPVYMAKPAPFRVLISSVHKLLPYGFVRVEDPEPKNLHFRD